MVRLLNSLRECKRPAGHCYPIFAIMLLDIQRWPDFLLRFHRVSLIKHSLWDFESLNFPLMPVFMVVAPLVTRSVLALLFADYISPSTLHTNALELFTIVVALKHWALQLQGHKFIIACDNSAAIAVINSTTSKDPFMQRCLRQLWFTTAFFDFEPRAPRVPGKHNQFADCLSRWHSDASARDGFFRLCSNSNQFFSFSRC